jgi:hypothetical protein
MGMPQDKLYPHKLVEACETPLSLKLMKEKCYNTILAGEVKGHLSPAVHDTTSA